MRASTHSAGPAGSSYATALAVWWGGAVVAAAVAFWLATLGPGETTICLLRNWTGIACPGCGVTRSIAALLDGDIAAAFAFHPLAPIAVIEVGLVWIAWGVSLARFRRGFDERLLAGLFALNVAAFVLLWFVRFFRGTLPG